MPKFEKNGLTVETDLPREAARLRAEGFREVKIEDSRDKGGNLPTALGPVLNTTGRSERIGKPTPPKTDSK